MECIYARNNEYIQNGASGQKRQAFCCAGQMGIFRLAEKSHPVNLLRAWVFGGLSGVQIVGRNNLGAVVRQMVLHDMGQSIREIKYYK